MLMDIPAIQVVKSIDSVINDGLLLSQASELYLRLKSMGKDKVFTRTAKRNTNYVTQLLGDKATGRLGDLKLRENYVFVFCVFG